MKQYNITFKFKRKVGLKLYSDGFFTLREIKEEHWILYNANSEKHAFMLFQKNNMKFYGSLDAREVLDIKEIL